MNQRKFFSAEDAARFAASITDAWQTEEGDIWDKETLIDVSNCADGENPLYEEDTEIYYIVDENGAVGYTEDDCGDIYWWVTPVSVASHEEASEYCPNCGAKTGPGWRFCQKCGHPLR